MAQSRKSLGSHGQTDCVDCGEPIAPKRLAANPHACRCLDCQNSLEQGG
ncbi:TraR/DksA C4-type zinc finger protein [Thalassospira sp.]